MESRGGLNHFVNPTRQKVRFINEIFGHRLYWQELFFRHSTKRRKTSGRSQKTPSLSQHGNTPHLKWRMVKRITDAWPFRRLYEAAFWCPVGARGNQLSKPPQRARFKLSCYFKNKTLDLASLITRGCRYCIKCRNGQVEFLNLLFVQTDAINFYTRTVV